MDRKDLISKLFRPRNNGRNRDERASTKSGSATPGDSNRRDTGPLVYGWIEFPERAAHQAELRHLIEQACRSAKAREQFGGVIQLQDEVPNGRFRDLEASFQRTDTPFDFGGEDPIDHMPWEGWWRPGRRRPVVYEVASSGEQFVPLNDLRSLMAKEDEGTLKKSLAALLGKHDRSPPTDLLAEA